MHGAREITSRFDGVYRKKKYRCCISRERYSIRQLCNGERVVIILHKRAIDELKFSFNFLHFEFRLTLYNMEYVSQNSPFSPIHIYIYIYTYILPVRLQVSGKLYDSDGEAFRRITFLGIDFTTPLYLYCRRFIRVETSYLRGYTMRTTRRRRRRGREAGYSTDGMKWNNKGREEGKL